jgi:hypothetical protein
MGDGQSRWSICIKTKDEAANRKEILPICWSPWRPNQSRRGRKGLEKCPAAINCGQSAPLTPQVACREMRVSSRQGPPPAGGDPSCRPTPPRGRKDVPAPVQGIGTVNGAFSRFDGQQPMWPCTEEIVVDFGVSAPMHRGTATSSESAVHSIRFPKISHAEILN